VIESGFDLLRRVFHWTVPFDRTLGTLSNLAISWTDPIPQPSNLAWVSAPRHVLVLGLRASPERESFSRKLLPKAPGPEQGRGYRRCQTIETSLMEIE